MRTALHKTYTLPLSLSIAAGIFAMLMPWLPLKAVLASAYALGAAYTVGSAWISGERWGYRLTVGFGILTAAIAGLGALVYAAANLGGMAVAFVVAAAPVGATLAGRAFAPQAAPFGSEERNSRRASISAIARAGAALLGVGVQIAVASFAFSILRNSATDIAIRSPWDVVPAAFLALIAVIAALAVSAAFGRHDGIVPLAATAILAAAVLTVARTVYDVGFGFDPFIHRATEAAIVAHGAITPKPFYYLGQYALVAITSRLAGVDAATVDVLLVPYGFLAMLPIAAWALTKALRDATTTPASGLIAILLFPLASFIATTPQGLANIFLLAAGFAALAAFAPQPASPALPMAFALAAAAVHPITGLPLLAFAALPMASAYIRRPILRRAIIALIVAAGAVAIPLAFAVNSRVSTATAEVGAPVLRAAVQEDAPLLPAYAPRYSAALDAAYFWKFTRPYALLALAAVGLAFAWRRLPKTRMFALGAVVFGANAFLLARAVRFPFLIEYERTNYADRFAELSLLFFAPLAAVALAALIGALRKKPAAARASLAVMLAGLLVASAYLAYPRRDVHEASRGWSTSAADIETVRSVQKDSAGTNYVALANQSTSAAAVREFGFARYYESRDKTHPGLLFYYPIPTGDRLYERFLAMNESLGARTEAIKAMDLVGTDLAYYAVSKYWWQAQRIVAKAKKEADAWWKVGDGDVFVFKYLRR